MTYPRRLIEVDLPIKRISAHARREKSIRHGHISTLHIWWARRPLAACRAVICAALWPDPADPICPQAFRDKAAQIITDFAKKAATTGRLMDTCSKDSFSRWEILAKENGRLDGKDAGHVNIVRFALLDFIADFANWDNSTVPEYLETARGLTQAAHEALGGEKGTRPLVVDPFAGGGSIPLEALRVGADAFASDLNPVAVLLNKVVLEYIPKYGQKLADEVRKCGKWIKEQAENELKEFYPNDPDGAIPAAFIWARSVLSEAPGDGDLPVEIPLMRSMWLSKKAGRLRALRWVRDRKGEIVTNVESVAYCNGKSVRVRRPQLEVFEPRVVADVEQGTSKGGAATCPITGFTTSVESVRKQLLLRNGGTADARLTCVVTSHPKAPGRVYRPATERDNGVVRKCRKRYDLMTMPGSSSAIGELLPVGHINHLRGFFNIVLYGMTEWAMIFSPRQALSLTTLTRLVRDLRQARDRSDGLDGDFGDAVQTCLALSVSRHADINASLAMWHTTRELITHVFGRQALPMVWDYAEANTFGDASGSFLGGVDWIARIAENPVSTAGTAQRASATAHPLPNDSVDAVISDPPYYAAIPYADLSDFFYSWLKKSLEVIHPSLFNSELTPKDEECVQLSHRAAMYREKDAAWFEQMMAKALVEARRVDRGNGVGVFVFANKETSGWEAMLTALVGSNWIVTASWPIDTEMGNRLRARNSAALASSVHLVCRPRLGSLVGDWRDVLAELPKRIHEWMPRLASEGVVGADAIFACLGPALEIFSRYSKVEKADGTSIPLKDYLEHVWAAVSKEALSMIFAGADATGFEPDARLTAMWLWTLSTGTSGNGVAEDGESEEESDENEETSSKPAKGGGFVLEYDAARKIAQGLGAHLEHLNSLVEVKGDKATLLPVAGRARHLFGKDEGKAPAKKSKKPKQRMLPGMGDDDGDADASESGWGEISAPEAGATTLDRIHQSMILFAAGRGEALKRFMVEEGVGQDQRFWRLAQALSALYPAGTEEKRWVDGVLARKKGLGF